MKPRLSMKLLWKYALEFLPGHTNSEKILVKNFLEFVEQKLKTNPSSL